MSSVSRGRFDWRDCLSHPMISARLLINQRLPFVGFPSGKHGHWQHGNPQLDGKRQFLVGSTASANRDQAIQSADERKAAGLPCLPADFPGTSKLETERVVTRNGRCMPGTLPAARRARRPI